MAWVRTLRLTVGAAALVLTAGTTTTTVPEPAVAVLPTISADPGVLDADQQAALIAAQLGAPTSRVAAPGETGTICAVVALAAPVTAGGRWERDGETVRDVGATLRAPPGYGDCLTGDGGRPLAAGVYQFVADGPAVTSGAATFVVGAEPVTVRFVNDGAAPVCLLLVSPTRADRYEAYRLEPALAPGEVAAIALAAVDQDVGVFECAATDELAPTDRPARSFTFTPTGAEVTLSGE